MTTNDSVRKPEKMETVRTPSSCCGGPREQADAPVTIGRAVPNSSGPAGSAGSPPAQAEGLEADALRERVRERYGALASGTRAGSGCCSGEQVSTAALAELGYTAQEAEAIPEASNLGLGCGNPLAYAGARTGETVLDLGSGAGIDCFLAARAVGPGGRVIGVDMTPAMVSRARTNAAEAQTPNVEFRLGEIEHLPVADASVDLIISNCVINLSPEKPQVFREAWRVLKPGGRLLVSDLVLLRPLPEEVRQSVALYVGCVAGASTREDYLAQIREAGFEDVEIVAENAYTCGEENYSQGTPEQEAFRSVSSVKVRAIKRA